MIGTQLRAPYAGKLNVYKNKLQKTKQELLDEYIENLTKLQNKKDELMNDVEKRIAEVTKDIVTIEDVKEKANVRTTVRERLTKLEVIENIKKRIMQTCNRPLQYTSHEVTDVETTVYLSEGKEGFLNKTIRIFGAGMKRVLLIFIAWVILAQVNVILDLVTINEIVADIVNKIIRFVLPSMCTLDVATLVFLALFPLEIVLIVKLMRRLNTWFWHEVGRTKKVKIM